MRTSPGEMRTRVTLQQSIKTKDSVGQSREEWRDVFTCYAAVRPLSAKEVYYANSTKSESLFRIALRWRPGVRSKDRFKLSDGRILYLTGVLNIDERNAELVCTASETPP